MDTPGAQGGGVSRGSNVSYFLFLSLMFFLMSSGPDTTSELQYRSALTRLTRERDEFKEWLYPGSVPITNSTTGGSSTTVSEGSFGTASDSSSSFVTSVALVPTAGLDGDDTTAGPSNDTDTPPTDEFRPFVLEDWTPPSTIRSRVDGLLRERETISEPLYFHNVSGFFKGTYRVHTDVNVTDGALNSTEISRRLGSFPWSSKSSRKGDTGQIVRLNVRETVPHVKGKDVLKEREQAEAVIIRGSLELELHDMLDEKTGDIDTETRTTELDLEGIHWLHNGTFFLHAAAPWHDLDMRQLPGLMLSNQTRNETAQVVLKELDARLERIKLAIATGRFGDGVGESEGDTNLNCTFSMYGHLRNVPSDIPASRLKEWEDELHNPSGVSTVDLPPPTLNAILFSKECNLVLELDNMVGLELERFWNEAVAYSFILAILTVLQTWVLVRQMEYTSTPVAIGKVSHLTIAMQVMIDVYFCVTHLTLGVVTGNKSSKAFLVPGFFGILSGLLFGLRYAAIIRVTTYRPEPTPTTATTPAAAPQVLPASETASGAPATRRSTEIPNTSTPLLGRSAADIAAAAAEDDRQDLKQMGMIVAAATTIGVLFYFVGWFALLMTLTYSFWIPQIYHNAERGTGRNALLKQYIVVTAITRLFIPLYIWAYPGNLLFADTSPWVFAIVTWQAFQVTVLFLQDLLGPRFFLPKGLWFPELNTWDYHPILPPSDIESGLVSGAEAQDGSKSVDGERKGEVDCVICFEKIELARPGGERGSLDAKINRAAGDRDTTSAMGDVFGAARRGANRMSYMVPPCHHIAHTSCLESWAAIKMECPLCRRPLPPF